MSKFALYVISVSLTTGLLVGIIHNSALSDYDKCRKSARKLVWSGQYHRARFWASKAMKLRDFAVPAGCIEDEFFVDDLLSLGMYEQAEKLSRSLPPVAQLYPDSDCDWATYRQNLHIKALVGLHLYITAAMEAKSLSGCDNAAEAFFAINDIRSAELANNRFPELRHLYQQLTELSENDEERAQSIAKGWVSYFGDSRSDRIYEFEFCEQMMLRKKCLTAAKILSLEANRTRLL